MARPTRFAKSGAKVKGRSASEFTQQFDRSFIVPKKIAEALKKLGDAWVYERELMALAGGVSTTEIARYREKFEGHVVETNGRNPRRLWCGTAKFATKLRLQLGQGEE
jgi:hypothetical protein